MKFTVEREALETGVAAALRAVSSKSPIPILAGLYLETGDGNIRAVGTDLDLTIGIDIPAEVEVEGRTVIPAKLLHDIARKVNGAIVGFELADGQVRIVSGSASFEICTMNPDEFPTFPEVHDDGNYIPGGTLVTLINQTVFAVSKDPTKPFITGVQIEIGEKLVMSATDGFRLAVSKAYVEQEDVPAVIVPTSALKALASILGDENPTVEVSIGDKLIAFKKEGLAIVSRIISGKFPDYRRLISGEAPSSVIEVDREELLEAIERVSVMSRDEFASVEIRLDSKKQEILVGSRKESELGWGMDRVQCEIHHGVENWIVRINCRYMLEGLKAMKGKRVTIAYADPEKPVLLGDSEKDTEYVYAVMPVAPLGA